MQIALWVHCHSIVQIDRDETLSISNSGPENVGWRVAARWDTAQRLWMAQCWIMVLCAGSRESFQDCRVTQYKYTIMSTTGRNRVLRYWDNSRNPQHHGFLIFRIYLFRCCCCFLKIKDNQFFTQCYTPATCYSILHVEIQSP